MRLSSHVEIIPLISLCMITYNRGEQLYKTLQNLEDELSGLYNILVLNNASNDNTMDILNQKFADKQHYRIFDSQVNLGVARGREYLWKAVNTKYIISLDDDILITKDTIDRMIEKLENVNDVALVSPDIKDSISGKVINNMKEGFFQLPTFYEACFAIRKSTVDQIGHFDSNLQVAGEGLDYALRLQKADFSIYRTHNISVIHVDRARERNESRNRRQQWLWSFSYVYWKNMNVFKAFIWTLRNLIAHAKTGFGRFGLFYVLTLPKFAIMGLYKGLINKKKMRGIK